MKGGDDDDEDDEEEDIEDDEDGLLASFICQQPFVDPVVTKSKHYFCEHCALKIILDVPTVGGRLMLVDMAGSENIAQAGLRRSMRYCIHWTDIEDRRLISDFFTRTLEIVLRHMGLIYSANEPLATKYETWGQSVIKIQYKINEQPWEGYQRTRGKGCMFGSEVKLRATVAYVIEGMISVPSKFDKVDGMQQWEDVVKVYRDKKVYEYMENGSLAQKLHFDMLDWGKRFDIPVGTAKGLAYLHEECLEWVLHCDVKPHNILLDSNCKPKVADFGLCKLLDKDGTRNTVEILEMITGRSPADEQSEVSEARLYRWVAEPMKEAGGKNDWIEEVVDSTVDGEYAINKMKILINVALLCSAEDMDARPTMTQVVHMLLHVEEGDDHEENGIESLPLLKVIM
ncbi:putative receptor protein kinase ZmPK1 [Tanacetum coccineum]